MKKEKKTIGLNLVSLPKQKAGVGFLAINLFKELIPNNDQFQFIAYSEKETIFEELVFPHCLHRSVAPRSAIKKNNLGTVHVS